MAINKRKILQSAQKHMQKGALDKALKDYATLLETDPNDVNIRLKVGDIHLKQGRTSEAVESYLKVAQRFMKDGFDSKAIALYKQVTKIDPKRYDVYVPLSELYQRLGLSSDAMKALQTAADAHYREGDKDQALDLLRKMATLDPSNTTNRLKVGELLRQEGREAEALAEYDEVVEELERQGDAEERIKVLNKILDLDPSRVASFVVLGGALVEHRKWSQAEAVAEVRIDAFPGEPEGYELLTRVYEQSGREEDLAGVYRRLAEVYKDRGDEDHAREIMQRFVSTEALGAEENGAPVLGEDDQVAMDTAIGGDGAYSLAPDQVVDPGFVQDDRLQLGNPIGDLVEEQPAIETDPSGDTASLLPQLPPLETEPVSDEEGPGPEGDPEQLLAEASVYLRYGKHERAIESLRGVLSQDPGRRAALEKLGEALVATGDEANAVTAFSRAAVAAQAEGDDAGFESLRAKTEALDPAAAQALVAAAAPPEAVSPAAADATQHLEDLDIEIDAEPEIGGADEILESDDSIEFEIEEELVFDDAPDEDEEAVAESALSEAATPDSGEGEYDLGDSGPISEILEEEIIEEEIVFDDAPDEDEEAVAESAPSEAATPDSEEEEYDLGDSGPTSEILEEESIEEELIFEDAPDEDEEAVAESAPSEAATPDSEEEEEYDLGDSDPVFESLEEESVEEELGVPASRDSEAAAWETSLEETLTSDASAPSQSTGSSTTPQQMIEDLEEADFYFQQGLHDEAEEVYRRILNIAPNHPQAMLRLGEIEAARSEPGDAPQEPDSQPGVELDSAVAAEEPPRAALAPEEPAAEAGDAFQEPPPSGTEPGDSGADDFSWDLPDAPSLPGFEGAADLDLDGDAPEASAVEAEPATGQAPAAQAEQTMPLVGDTTAPMHPDASEAAAPADFDLAAELSGALDGADSGPVSRGRGGTTEEEGFEQVFAAFKQGVQQELGDGDFEAHYDLGIAYKEMGLLEDAIGEFQIALGGPLRKLASLHAMGLCALEMERVSDAVSHLEQALALPEVPPEQLTALHFDLGRAYEQQGDLARARGAYQAVVAVDPEFGEVGERIEELERRESGGGTDELAAEQEEETFESFDDLIEGGAPPPESERYESFEDLMSGNGDGGDAAVDESEPPLATAAEPEPAAAEIEAEAVSEAESAAEDAEPEPAAEEAEPESAEAEPESGEAEAEPVSEPESGEAEAEPTSEPESGEAEAEAEPAPEPEREPDNAPEASAPKKPTRRKKISFV